MRALQPAAVACVLLNAAVATFGAAVAGELYASRTAIFVLGRRGPGRPLRSRLSVAAGGVFLLVLMLLPGVAVGLIAGSANGESLQGWVVGMRVTAWVLLVVVWTFVGLAVQLSRTRAYRQGYRDGVPAWYWFLSSAATMHRSGDGGFAFVLVQAQRFVPTGATIVTVTRTEALLKIYERYGFRRVRGEKLVLIRPSVDQAGS